MNYKTILVKLTKFLYRRIHNYSIQKSIGLPLIVNTPKHLQQLNGSNYSEEMNLKDFALYILIIYIYYVLMINNVVRNMFI